MKKKKKRRERKKEKERQRERKRKRKKKKKKEKKRKRKRRKEKETKKERKKESKQAQACTLSVKASLSSPARFSRGDLILFRLCRNVAPTAKPVASLERSFFPDTWSEASLPLPLASRRSRVDWPERRRR